MTIENLSKRGLQIPNRCVLCKNQAEFVDHLFIHCSFTREVWSIFSQAFGMSWCAPISTIEFFNQWDDSWKGSGLQAISKWALPHFGWGIWKEHNNRIFRVASLPTNIVSSRIQNALLENYMFNKGSNSFVREIGSSNDTYKRRKECQWSLPPEGWHKDNFDGATKCNPGAMRSGGVIINCCGYGIAVVSFPMGHQTNHYAEACATLQTTKLAKEVGLKSL